MASTEQTTTATAVSRDGTRIAYRVSGEGPPLVLVHGATADHTRWRPLLPYLEPHATVCAVERRGRGASGDAAEYSIEREYEDVAAVVDAVAEATGERVDLLGHSYGGACAFGGAALTSNLRRLVLYEGWPVRDPALRSVPAGTVERLEALLAAGEREAVLETTFREVVEMSDGEIEGLRAQPSWQSRVAAAHTLPRELRTSLPFDPEQASRIQVPVLLLTGGDSPESQRGNPEAIAEVLPDARIRVIPGQQHVADVMVPEVFAGYLLEFLLEEPR